MSHPKADGVEEGDSFALLHLKLQTSCGGVTKMPQRVGLARSLPCVSVRVELEILQ